MIDNIKQTIESILFSTGKRLDLKEIARLCRTRDVDTVKTVLEELKKEHEEKNSSLIILRDGDFWRMTVKDQYLPFVRKVVTQTELTKSVMETLAVIAYKAPVLQSNVIKIRTNKAYDHLNDLENTGFITREKKGRTKLIKLTEKFFTYFDVSQERLKQTFSDAKSLAKEVEHLEKIKETVEKLEEKQTPEIDLIDNGKKVKLETYHTQGTELDHLGILKDKESEGLFSEGMSEELKKKIEEKAEEIIDPKEDEEFNDKDNYEHIEDSSDDEKKDNSKENSEADK